MSIAVIKAVELLPLGEAVSSEFTEVRRSLLPSEICEIPQLHAER